ELIRGMADHVLWLPEAPWMLVPVLTVLPLQMLAYHIATIRGLDVDQPRNLAKSVPVEYAQAAALAPFVLSLSDSPARRHA
ncbi:MAG TPA: hypothetical protein VMJ64_04385, partial [Anaerolineales bacterium]|nr:hypothetical protein [Anaerolineales bacterium]